MSVVSKQTLPKPVVRRSPSRSSSKTGRQTVEGRGPSKTGKNCRKRPHSVDGSEEVSVAKLSKAGKTFSERDQTAGNLPGRSEEVPESGGIGESSENGRTGSTLEPVDATGTSPVFPPTKPKRLAENLTTGMPFDLASHLDAARKKTRRDFDPDAVRIPQPANTRSSLLHTRPEFCGAEISNPDLEADENQSESAPLVFFPSDGDHAVRIGLLIAQSIDHHVDIRKMAETAKSIGHRLTTTNSEREIVCRRQPIFVRTSPRSAPETKAPPGGGSNEPILVSSKPLTTRAGPPVADSVRGMPPPQSAAKVNMPPSDGNRLPVPSTATLLKVPARDGHSPITSGIASQSAPAIKRPPSPVFVSTRPLKASARGCQTAGHSPMADNDRTRLQFTPKIKTQLTDPRVTTNLQSGGGDNGHRSGSISASGARSVISRCPTSAGKHQEPLEKRMENDCRTVEIGSDRDNAVSLVGDFSGCRARALQKLRTIVPRGKSNVHSQFDSVDSPGVAGLRSDDARELNSVAKILDLRYFPAVSTFKHTTPSQNRAVPAVMCSRLTLFC